MSFELPAIIGSLGDGRSFTARFDSFNERTDDVYFLVTLRDGERDAEPFMVQLGVAGVADDAWGTPAFLNELRERLARVAATGKTNTEYTGPVMRL